MRKTYEQLNKLKNKFGVDTLWSWSKYNSYKTDPYGWMLNYLQHVKGTRKSIYSVEGGVCHDIVERYYNKEISYEDMINEYEDKLIELNMAGLKYNRSDEKANESTATKYENNVRLFYKNHIPIEGKTITEQFVTIKVGDNYFQGYIDFINKDKDGNYIITDWKTSTLYVGKKILKERGQLVLYAESLIQKGIPLERIKIRWNFLKYCNIEYQLKGIDKETKTNKLKVTNELRDRWVSKKSIQSNLAMWLKESGYEELEIEDMIQTAISNNNLDNIPKDIQSKYKLSDCYVYIPLDKEAIDNLKEDIINTIDEINEKVNDYNIYMDQGEKEEAENLFWINIDDASSYYFANLCEYSPNQHRPYKEYLESTNIWTKEDKSETDKDDLDDDWLNNL